MLVLYLDLLRISDEKLRLALQIDLPENNMDKKEIIEAITNKFDINNIN